VTSRFAGFWIIGEQRIQYASILTSLIALSHGRTLMIVRPGFRQDNTMCVYHGWIGSMLLESAQLVG
jgi:hypothetical protein